MNEFFVYIIYSKSRNRYYVGSCADLQRRIEDHHAGRSPYTQSGKPWTLKYSESFVTRASARNREKEIKNRKSRRYIEYLISSVG